MPCVTRNRTCDNGPFVYDRTSDRFIITRESDMLCMLDDRIIEKTGKATQYALRYSGRG